MRGFFIGVLFVLFINIGGNIMHLSDNRKISHVGFIIMYTILQGNYLIFPLTGRCGIENAEYFDCDKFQKAINIE